MTTNTTDWKSTLTKSATLLDKSNVGRKQASALLWQGAKAGIREWLPTADTDVSAEAFYSEVLDSLGKTRKGDASKIKTVALAVKNNGLALAAYPNLSKAYGAAVAMTKTVATQQNEDEAAEKAIEAISANLPTVWDTPEQAAHVVLSKGVDEAARLLLDALGASNEAAHRALLRAISQEIAGRVKPKVSTVKAGPKAGATQAGATGSTPKAAAIKTATTKPKAAAPVAKAAPTAKAVVQTKAKPVAVAVPKVEEVPAEAAAPVVQKAKPVIRRPKAS